MAFKNFVVLLSVFAVATATGQLVGGASDAEKNDPEILKMLDFAMNEFNKMSNNMYRFMPASVKEATKQVCVVTCLFN